ncbi:MAG: alpha/beta hydrolase [Bacteroidia bacterium]|nr:alpha/beta hydrolase [Bacteroidia bacterium]
MFFKTSDGRNLYYEFQGNRNSQETIVFLNGLTQSTLSWAFMIPFFEKNYNILLLDFIFQGQSDKYGPYKNFDSHARDVYDLCHKENIQNPIIVGLSYGSLVAQHVAVNYPKFPRKLFLLSTFCKKTPYFEAIELSWWRSLQTGGYDLLLDTMLPFVLSEEYFKNPFVPIEKLKNLRKEVNSNKEALLKLMQATKERHDYCESLRKIEVPSIIIHGEKDTLMPLSMANEVHSMIPHSKFYVIPNTGHTLNLENYVRVVEIIKKCIMDM